MDEPLNRMNKPGRKPEGTYKVEDAPPVILHNKVMPCTCPRCGKSQSPLVLRKNPTYSDVRCTACASNFQYHHATESQPIPRVRFVPI